MDLTHLQQHYNELLDYLEQDGYTKSYIRQVREQIGWLLKHAQDNTWKSYVDAYNDRAGNSQSKLYRKNLKIAFCAIQQFDLYGQFPDRRAKNCFIKRGAYHQLLPEFRELVDYYRESDEAHRLKESTVYHNSMGASSFLLYMQQKGIAAISDITEKDPLSFFHGEDGSLKSNSYKKEIAAVFKAGIHWKEECRPVPAYLPPIRPRRKNIQFLTPEETTAIRAGLEDESSGLSFRNRAIGALLFFTGLRACDVAGMELKSVDWDEDMLRIPQQKTRCPLILPLTAAVGNAIYDYLKNERPDSADSHLFLSALYPHRPLEAGSIWHHAESVYKAAAIRRASGDRRGTHLFRHNVATSFLGSGVQHPVISQTLGHTDPGSLEPYLHADMAHLKECSLSIGAFPLGEEVLHI